MKSAKLSVALAALTMSCGMTATASDSLSPFTPKVLPVLVQVDAHGKVTGASPATELPPKLNRLLRASLDEMVTAPAINKRGRPTSSQFLLTRTADDSMRHGCARSPLLLDLRLFFAGELESILLG